MKYIPCINIKRTGENIKRLRKERGLTVVKLQEEIEVVERQAIYKWESGTTLPCIENLLILGAVLGVNIEDILVIEWL